MMTWTIHQIAEYFSAITGLDDEPSMIALAVERATEMSEAELGAVLIDGRVYGAWGFGDDVPVASLNRTVDERGLMSLAGFGEVHTVLSPLGSDISADLLVARLDDPFAAEERQMLRGMARMLGLALRSVQALEAERTLRVEREFIAAERLVLLKAARTRQRLVESLLAIQQSISARHPVETILDAITAGAANLLGNGRVTLVLAKDGDHESLVTASSFPLGASLLGDSHGVRDEVRRAMLTGSVVAKDLLDERNNSVTVLAAAVRVAGNIAGSLVARLDGDPVDIDEKRDRLVAFAQQVSFALTDAQSVKALSEAHHDTVTGLPNRVLFRKELSRAVIECRGDARRVNVLFIDLDRFKAVNDTLGHEAGDRLLFLVGVLIKGCLRSCDTVARLGGDEFAVLVAGAPMRQAVAIGERIIASIEEPFRIGSSDVSIGASIGVAGTGSPSLSPDELLRNADIAMYQAKRERAGQVVVYNESMHF
jgi:diguanylate cyclase (GGDEF)-like protein